jgi:la-related protein 4
MNIFLESPSVEVDIEEKKVRSSYIPTRKRCIIILRNVPYDAKENEILELFINKSCPVSPIGCERVLESDHLDCWYVTFNTEDDAQNAFLYLTRENISIRGQKILVKNFFLNI